MVGDNKLDCNEDVGSLAINFLETKILLNSIILDTKRGVRFMYTNMKDHFLATLMKDPEYI